MSRPASLGWPAARPAILAGSRDQHLVDRLTARRVREMVTCRGGFDASGMSVEVQGGTAILCGTVDTARDAEETRRLAASVVGVHEVRNHLRVQGSRIGPISHFRV